MDEGLQVYGAIAKHVNDVAGHLVASPDKSSDLLYDDRRNNTVVKILSGGIRSKGQFFGFYQIFSVTF